MRSSSGAAGMSHGSSTKPVKLPVKKPKCFPSQQQWEEYKHLAKFSARSGFDHCRDCMPAYRDKMVAQRRCAYPRTEFTAPYGSIVGLRRK